MATWLVRIFLILLPLAILLYWFILKRSGSDKLDGQERILAITAGLSVIVTLIVIFVLSPMGAQPADAVYIPPHVVNGRVIDGAFISKEEAERRGISESRTQPLEPQDEFETFGD